MHTHYIPWEKLPILVVRIWYFVAALSPVSMTVEDQQQESNWYKQKNRRGILAMCPSPRPVQPPTVSESSDWYI